MTAHRRKGYVVSKSGAAVCGTSLVAKNESLLNYQRGNVMMKKLLIAATLVAPLVAFAADGATTNTVKSVKSEKKSAMIQCQQLAAGKKLEGVEKDQFMSKCLNIYSAKAKPAAN